MLLSFYSCRICLNILQDSIKRYLNIPQDLIKSFLNILQDSIKSYLNISQNFASTFYTTQIVELNYVLKHMVMCEAKGACNYISSNKLYSLQRIEQIPTT